MQLKCDAKVTVVIVMVAIFALQAGQFTIKYAKGTLVEQITTQPAFLIDQMTFCTQIHPTDGDMITKPDGTPLNEDERGELAWIESHSIYDDHIDASRLYPDETSDSVKRMNSSQLLDRFQEYHGFMYMKSANRTGVQKEKAYMVPFSRMKNIACGTVPSVNLSKFHITPVLQPESEAARWFFFYIPKFIMLMKRITYYTFYSVKESNTLDPNNHFDVLISSTVTEVGRVFHLIVAKVKPVKRVRMNTKNNPCEPPSSQYPPAGFAEAVCKAKCESKAFLRIHNCSNLVWLDQGIENKSAINKCRRDMFEDKVISLNEVIYKATQECIYESDCGQVKLCEEWELSTQITHGLEYEQNQFINTVIEENTLQGFLVIPEPSYTAYEEVYQISFITWIAYIGGMLGLWLGFGVMTIVLHLYEFAAIHLRHSKEQNVK